MLYKKSSSLYIQSNKRCFMGIQGDKPLSPQTQAIYKQQFAHGVDLFQRSLQEYQHAQEPHKKAKFKHVMDQALQVMNETSRAALGSKGPAQTSKLEQDYHSLTSDESARNYKKVNDDLENLKESL
jgi:hypothetical protein